MLRRTAVSLTALVILSWRTAAGADGAHAASASKRATKTSSTTTLSNGETSTTTTTTDGTSTTTTLSITSGNAPGGAAPAPDAPIDAGEGGTLAPDTSGRSCNRGATADAKGHVDLYASDRDYGLGFDSRTGSLQVRFRVVNLGTAASGSFVSGVYLYPASGTCRAYPVGTIRTRALRGHRGRTLTGVFDLRDPSKRPPAGDYRIGVVVDVTGARAERDETNNLGLLPGTIRFE